MMLAGLTITPPSQKAPPVKVGMNARGIPSRRWRDDASAGFRRSVEGATAIHRLWRDPVILREKPWGSTVSFIYAKVSL